MSKVDVFDVTVSQLEDFSNVSYEDLSVSDFVDCYLVVTTWSWFGKQPRSMMVALGPVTCKEEALQAACVLDSDDLTANRWGISCSGNHYEVWHVVNDFEPASTDWFADLGNSVFSDEYIQALAMMF